MSDTLLKGTHDEKKTRVDRLHSQGGQKRSTVLKGPDRESAALKSLKTISVSFLPF